MVAACLLGCDKKSGLKGLVVDCQGYPLVGVKVVAKPVAPDKGSDLSETFTGPDGTFTLCKLVPSSSYELLVGANGATSKALLRVASGAAGATAGIPEPITIRFIFAGDKATALDTRTGLEWSRNANVAGRQMSWDEAMSWAHEVEIGGHKDWRLPTKEELETFIKSGGAKPEEYFTSTGFVDVPSPSTSWYWSSTSFADRSNYTWIVALWDGSPSYDFKGRNYNVWPVRVGE